MWGNNNVSRKNVFRPPGRVFTMESWSEIGYCDYCSDFGVVIRLINALPERLSCAQGFQGEWFPAFWGQYVVSRVKRITFLALEWPPVFYSNIKMKDMSHWKTGFLAQADVRFAISLADGYMDIQATLILRYRPIELKLGLGLGLGLGPQAEAEGRERVTSPRPTARLEENYYLLLVHIVWTSIRGN